MTINDQIYITSLSKQLDEGRITGKINGKMLVLFELLDYYDKWTRNKAQFQDVNKFIKDQITTLTFKYPDIFCEYNAVLPSGSYFTDAEAAAAASPPVDTNPTLSDLTVPATFRKIYDNSDELYYSYKFNKSDILNVYDDLKDDDFYQLKIDMTNLDTGSIQVLTDTGNQIFEQNNSSITVLASDLNNIIYFTNNTTQSSYDIFISVIDKDSDGNFWISNTATLTMDKTAISSTGNQPPTIGDAAIKVGNQVTTTLTLAMFTTDLTPPYNDPEGDALDAIRIDEISTANTGEFRLNNVAIADGQVITVDEINAGDFTHVGASSNDIETDSFNFSVRDAVSQIWVQ